MHGIEELPLESRRDWDHLRGSWKQYRQLVEHLQSLIRSSNWPAFLQEEASRRVREALEQVFASLREALEQSFPQTSLHAAPEEQVVLWTILRLMKFAEPVNWPQIAHELAQWSA